MPANVLRRKVILGTLGLLLTLLLAAGCSRTPPVSPTNRTRTAAVEDPLVSAREVLLKSGDLVVCRHAVQQLNQHLTRENRPELTETQRQMLTERWQLTAEELGEIAGSGLTFLDAYHLETCLLFRDAIQPLGVDQLPPAEQAAAVFRWCMRQVRLQDRPGPLVPPQLVLRRGWGNALERALVFLGLLSQLGLDGCLLALPGPALDQPRHWSCGVLIPTEAHADILIFDPRLGLPLPGPKGRGTATLAQVFGQPELLKQLTVDSVEYDVTPEQARNVELRVAAPLSAYAPRLKAVQEALAAALGVKLAVDPVELLKKFDVAAGALNAGVRPPVRGAREVVAVLRDYVPAAEGGVGKTYNPLPLQVPLEFYPQFNLGKEMDAVYLGLFTRPFRDFALEARMPREEYLRGHFFYLGKPSNPEQARATFFERAAENLPDADKKASTKDQRDQLSGGGAEQLGRDPAGAQVHTEVLDRARMPRDLVLRGKYDEAAKFLVSMREQLRTQKERLRRGTDLPKILQEWHGRMVNAQGEFLRAQQGQGSLESARRQRDQLWAEGDKYLIVVLEGRAAEPLLEEVTFQLALCKHEHAERLQARLHRHQADGKTVPSLIANEVREAWGDAAHWWDTLLEESPQRPLATAARRWRARVHEALGERAAAVTMLQHTSPDLAALERLGRIQEAQRLKAP